LQCGGAVHRVPVVADRFLADEEDGVIDLATGESVRLAIAASLPREDARQRSEMCDRLFALRHPLLIPLIDYGGVGGDWFEAHAVVPPLRVSAADARRAALHLLRFLRRAGVVLSGDAAGRHVRPALEGPSIGWRPIGLSLHWRSAIETVRTVLECDRPPGVTPITVHGRDGTGLRTARLQVARVARLAGYAVIDSRFGALPDVLSSTRHFCVLDWLTQPSALPSILSIASASGALRHAWIRFSRERVNGSASLELEPLIMRDLTNIVFIDDELGPSAADVRVAAAAARGLPGALASALTARRSGRGVSWVHESAPAYVPQAPDAGEARALLERGAGIGRLERAASAALSLAARGRHARASRVLRRCAEGLAVRGAASASASAWCALGELLLARGRAIQASDAFDRARRIGSETDTVPRALVGAGLARLEQGQLSDAEAAFRTALLADDRVYQTASRIHLAFTLFLRRRFDAAEEVLDGRSPALLARIRFAADDLAGAAMAADEACRAADSEVDPGAAAEAHAAAALIDASLRKLEDARQHAELANAAARRTHDPSRVWRVMAETAAAFTRCGVVIPPERRRQFLRAVRRLPDLTAARIRAAVLSSHEDDVDLRRFVERSGATLLLPPQDDRSDLIQRFQALADVIHATPDDVSALQAIASDVLRASNACSVVIRSARLRRAVAVAGRAWPSEAALTEPLLDGADGLLKNGVTAEAAEPVRAAGSVLGSVAVRWIAGANPPPGRIRDLLRVAGAIAVPLLRAVTLPVSECPSAESQFPDYLLGRSAAAERVRESIRRAAAAPYVVLIEGESGSGKELVARAIHQRSVRRARRFAAVNCAALTDELLEAELFGHTRGAFTGAVMERQGLFEEADQGTLFLDEVGELSARAQAKLLRVLQEGEVRRVGESMPRRVDVRIVAATNRSIAGEVDAGRFRADLRFRLDVIRVEIPPLRDRAEDVAWLAERLWKDACERVATRATLGDDLLAALARYDWPGNVRELQNVVASIAVHAPRRGRISAAILPQHIAGGAARVTNGLDEARVEFERRYVRAALARAGGRKRVAAEQLRVTRQGLDKIMKRLGIEAPHERAPHTGSTPESRGGPPQ
jgi:transcriptional regulator with AAA-type ATPase domain/tetratricopeptide (TPR) repeat protein